ncbi:MAG: electron transport complex subunit RsxC [Candidatus Latescibacteria bacterium]|nr:electron transport complex subunit RsxC [Candidatus Latescibacterota bacterium]
MAGTFSGGVHPDDAKLLSNNKKLITPAIPSIVILPVRQHIGAPSKIVVEKGQQVKKGQMVAEAGGFVSVPQHASISGVVKAVEPRLSPMGIKVQSVVIESDGKDEWAEGCNTERTVSSMSSDDMREAVKTAGIVGLGGAAFPTHVKLSPPKDKSIDTVILNGVECEPYATCDHRIMLEYPEKIVKGLDILKKILGCSNAYIGIEQNKPDAIKVMRNAVKDYKGVKVVSLKVKYPQGGEKQLIYAVTKRKVPAGGLPMDVGCVVQNVGTAMAVYEAVALGIPLIQRAVTVTGHGVKEPVNVIARLGTTFDQLIENAGGYTENVSKLIMGGPMMGISQFTDEVPVVKGTSCILAMEEQETVFSAELPCISCGMCVDVCPMHLLPTTIASMVEHERWDDAKSYHILDCIECGCCTYICPTNRRLVENLKFGKAKIAEIRAKEQAQKKAAEEKK